MSIFLRGTKEYNHQQYLKIKKKKNYRCISCGALLSPFKRVKRCHSCFMERLHKKNVGMNHPNWTGKSICPKCGGKKSHESKMCINCKPKINRGTFKKGKLNRYYGVKGKANPNFKHGGSIVKSIRDSLEYDQWREAVFRRDNYTCQSCRKRGLYLNAHHIISFISIFNEFLKEYSQYDSVDNEDILKILAAKYKPFWNKDNGITLCIDCHNLTKEGMGTNAGDKMQ